MIIIIIIIASIIGIIIIDIAVFIIPLNLQLISLIILVRFMSLYLYN